MKNGDWRINRSPSATHVGRKEYYEKVKNRIFEILGHECFRCSFSDKRALQFDHIDGGGSKNRKEKSGTSYLHNILNAIKKGKKFQILCANCNWIKRAENNEQPVGKRTCV